MTFIHPIGILRAREWKEQVAHIRSLKKLKARVARLEQMPGDTGKTLPIET